MPKEIILANTQYPTPKEARTARNKLRRWKQGIVAIPIRGCNIVGRTPYCIVPLAHNTTESTLTTTLEGSDQLSNQTPAKCVCTQQAITLQPHISTHLTHPLPTSINATCLNTSCPHHE